jgi:hypothetical protein
MPIILIAMYCLVAVAILFGLTFRAELREEERRARPGATLGAKGGCHPHGR